MKKSNVFEVFEQTKGKRRLIYTQSLAPGHKVYDEDIVVEKGVEYRNWNPRKSKIAASIIKGCPNIGIRKNNVVLYLGSATGTTVSHVSDIVGSDGFIFALDFAPRVMRNLISVCEQRKNIAPVLADANHPEEYIDKVSLVDVVFQDVAQRNQVEIFLKNIRLFLKQDGYALLALKARSVDVTMRPWEVFKQVRVELEKHLKIVEMRDLKPFEMDHALFICKLK